MLNNMPEYIHIDEHGWCFVPNISLAFRLYKQCKLSTKTFDVHLMIVEPDKYIEQFKTLTQGIFFGTFEASTHHRTLQKYIPPESWYVPSIRIREDVINDVDIVCMMSVNPGFGGQKFIENTFRKNSGIKRTNFKRNAHTPL